MQELTILDILSAHRYIQDNCDNLGLHYVRALSADMDNLLKPEGQKQADDFFKYLLWSVENDSFEPVSAVSTAAKHAPVTAPSPSA